ncbi:uncharacterized protein EAF01_005536 [Botrytis porri]|uniref:Uncharacterized protein n=1 Tax=Botrytis porri TaxID=87229 RepID=A0A4Z1KQP6_9HELO|nr:uncharacterized protein EAF01_005536 [Botrytis porri]KAF7905014.1 hypothetical protein EAF01_005536 [Botrytis porri]TGO87012.1 hypothetical protein BPOR_0258g00010 [Botrytis porri]
MDTYNEGRVIPAHERKIAEKVQRKVQRCFEKQTGTTLSVKEAHWLDCICRKCPPLARNMAKDTEVFQTISGKAFEAANSVQSLFLTAREVEAYKYTSLRGAFYAKARSERPADDILIWFYIFERTYIDGTHCLDYQRDPFKDYSENVGINLLAEFAIASKPCFVVPGGREELAKEWYLCSVSSLEKLEDAKLWQVNATLSSREARVLTALDISLPVSKECEAKLPRNATRKQRMDMAAFEPENYLPGYLYHRLGLAVKNDTDITFTSDEAATLLIILTGNPVPKSDPSIGSPTKAVEYHEGNNEIVPPEWVRSAIEAQVKAGKEEPKRFKNGYPLTTKTPEQRKQWRVEEKERLIASGHTELAFVRKEPKKKVVERKVTINDIRAFIETNFEQSEEEHEKPEEEAEDRAKDDLILSLGKKIVAKERYIAEKETEMKHLYVAHDNREQALKSENSKLESALATTKEKLNKALKEPDKVRSEWSAKIQRLHEKISKLETELKAGQDALNITKLDSAETTNKLSRHKAAHERFVEKATELKKQRDEARQERDILRASRVSQAQLDDTKASEIARAVEEATKPLKATIVASEEKIATLETTIAKLKDDAVTRKNEEGMAALPVIKQLLNLEKVHERLKKAIIRERSGRAQDAVSWESVESDLQRQLQEEQSVSADLRSQIMQKSDGDTALLDQIAVLQERNARLEVENTQFRNVQRLMRGIGRL